MLTAEIRLTSEKYSEDQQRIQFYQRLMEEIRLIPVVRAMGAIDRVPIGDPGQNTHVHAADNPPLDPRDQKYAYDRTILPGYMEAMGIPLLAGRTIQDTDKQGSPRVVVINETMARKLFPGQNPIGQRVVVDVGQKVSAEIVGVVGNVQIGSLAEEPEMAMYGSYWQRPRSRMKITIRTSDKPESLAPLLRQAVWSLDKDIPVAGLASMEEIISDSVARPRINTVSLALLALLALLLAALGLYGVLSYNVSWRRHEIGIRMAVGASSRSILSMVLAQGLSLVAAGLLAGLAGAWWASGLLQGLLYGIEPTDPTTFAFACLFFVIVALLACIVPARRAVRVDPVTALRTQ